MTPFERMTTLRMFIESQQDVVVAKQIDPFTVEVRRRKPQPRRPNHALPVILSLLTCGLSPLVLLIVALIDVSEQNAYHRDPYLPGTWTVYVTEDGQIANSHSSRGGSRTSTGTPAPTDRAATD